MDDNLVEFLIFLIGGIGWIIKTIYDYFIKSNRKKEIFDEDVYYPENAEDMSIDEMIRRGLIDVIEKPKEKEKQFEEPIYEEAQVDPQMSQYVENLNSFAEQLDENETFALNQAPICEIEEIDYEDNVHDVDYAEFIRNNGKASIIISEIILPANSKMRR